MEKTSKQPAFPFPGHDHYAYEGLSKRELIAAMAMQGILAGRDPMGSDPDMKWAVKLADELLEQLSAAGEKV